MFILISNLCLAQEPYLDLYTAELNELTPTEEQAADQKITAFFLISSARDYIGKGKAKAYFEGQDGHFTIGNAYGKVNNVSINFNSKDWWYINFSVPGTQKLKCGIYKNAARFPFNDDQPGLSLSGCGRGCNELSGEFEILEISYNDDDKIESFAANFIQKCEITRSSFIR